MSDLASTALLVALAFGCGLGGALWLLRTQRAALAEEVRRAADADRDGELRTAIDQVIAVANERLGAHTAAVSGDMDGKQSLIAVQLTALRHELQRVTGVVSELEHSRERQYGALSEQITAAGRTTAALAETTQALREALASTKVRGQWGERMAEDVLRLAGFLEGVNYRKQRAVEGGGIPDFTFLLPEDREVRMDVKFPFDNYLRYLEADDDREADQHCKSFLRDVRNRVRELTTRDYMDPDRTVDCVLLFIPNEQLYGFIHANDAELLDVALRQKVVLCSPMTLFAVLAVIRQSTEAFSLARASDEVLSLLGAFTTQWDRFCGQMDTLGGHIERTQKAYEQLSSTRRRQLERQLDKLDDLREARGLRSASEASAGTEPEGRGLRSASEASAGTGPEGRGLRSASDASAGTEPEGRALGSDSDDGARVRALREATG